ncbi:hypothetical protein D3C77_483250 [compost metagenome]
MLLVDVLLAMSFMILGVALSLMASMYMLYGAGVMPRNCSVSRWNVWRRLVVEV